jgi:hypothetical protein
MNNNSERRRYDTDENIEDLARMKRRADRRKPPLQIALARERGEKAPMPQQKRAAQGAAQGFHREASNRVDRSHSASRELDDSIMERKP